MPAPTDSLLVRPITNTLRVELEPVHNAFNSLLLLAKANEKSGTSDWVIQTDLAMTPEERSVNNLVVIGLYYSIVPERSWPSFPAYVTYLESLSGESLRERILNKYASMTLCKDEDEIEPAQTAKDVDFDQVLVSPKSYLEFLYQHFDESYIDEDLETAAYAYIIDPVRMKSLIINHLKEMRSKYLAPEWERIRPILQDSVNAFRQVDLSDMPPLEAARFITGHELDEDKWASILDGNSQVTFVPSLHIGPYLWHWGNQDRKYILFGARIPAGVQLEAPELSRAEIIVRLNALADDSRLRLLHYLAHNGEQRSQDLIQMLDLSQSAVSRHLQQLTATGYLSERRCEGSKCYRINPERVSDTFHALEAFLKI